MRESPIFIVDTDAAKLRGLLAGRTRANDARDQEHLLRLGAELERAFVMKAGAVPRGVVMLNSEVQVVDQSSGVRRELTVVFPSESDPSAGRVSVLAPLGCALMGQHEGEIVEWEVPGGLRRLRIEKVTSAGITTSRVTPEATRAPSPVCTLGEARS